MMKATTRPPYYSETNKNKLGKLAGSEIGTVSSTIARVAHYSCSIVYPQTML